MVDADAQRHAAAAAEVEQRSHLAADAEQLVGILLVGILELDKCAARVGEVARIDAHLLHLLGCGKGSGGVEVYVGHQRYVAAGVAHGAAYVAQAACVCGGLGGEAHDIGAGPGDAQALGGAGLDVHGGGIGHRLYRHGAAVAYGDAADVHRCGVPARVLDTHIRYDL